jgi:hypothetical protein
MRMEENVECIREAIESSSRKSITYVVQMVGMCVGSSHKVITKDLKITS